MIGWTDEDYQSYRNKRAEVVAALHDLKMNQGDAAQQYCIDSICSLLLAKEKHLVAIMQTLDAIPDASKILHNKISTIQPKLYYSSFQKTAWNMNEDMQITQIVCSIIY